MIWGAFRIGRYAARAGGGGRQAPNQYKGLGTVLFVLVVVAIASLNWRVSLIVLGVMVALTVMLGLAGSAKHAPKTDPLDEAMREYGKGGRP